MGGRRGCRILYISIIEGVKVQDLSIDLVNIFGHCIHLSVVMSDIVMRIRGCDHRWLYLKCHSWKS